MSKDTDLYFRITEFPYKQWRDTLDIFTGEYENEEEGKFSIQLERRKADKPYTDEWVMFESYEESPGALWLSLNPFPDNYLWTLGTERPRWNIGLHWGSSTGFVIDLPRLIPLAAFLVFEEPWFYERNYDEFCFSLSEYNQLFPIAEKPIENLEMLQEFLKRHGKK